MSIRNQSLILWCSLLFSGMAFSQNDTLSELKIGQWQQRLPWQRVRYVTGSDAKVYCATEWAVVEIDKADHSPRFLTKVEGLSDIGMGIIRFSKAADVLLMTYNNSNIDLWHPSDGSVTNLPFIKKNVGLTGDKKIYNAFFEGKSAYLACGFGLVKLNLEREEVEYTVFTGTPVLACVQYDGQLYLGTDDGLYRLAENDPNPEDFGKWDLLGMPEGFPGDYEVKALATFDNYLYMGIDKSLYRYKGNEAPELLVTDAIYKVLYLTTEGNGLVIGWRGEFTGKVVYREANGSEHEVQGPCDAIRPIYAVEEGSRKYWFADDDDGFRVFDEASGQCERFRFNSPFSHRSAQIALAHDKVYVATPGPFSDLAPLYGRDGVFEYANGQWSQFSKNTSTALDDSGCWPDLWRVAVHPTEDRFFAGSWVGGVVEKSGTEVQFFNKNNSILQGAGAAGGDRTAIGGMAFDKDNNLWMSNYSAQKPIAVLKNDGTIRNFSGAPASNLLQVVVDQNGYKWFVGAFQGGVIVYDSGANIDDPSDDRYRKIDNTNSLMESNSVISLAVDLDGDVWVGTLQGVVSFECGSNVFDPSCKGSKRIVEVDGFNEYLLKTEEVRAIAVDGANRKWFGTTSGIFVQSASGDVQVARFTDTNSPLFDNTINSIAINPKNGEVWIGTEKGIQTIRSEATEGGKVNTPNVYAYPNPVRPDYDGPIAIYGLARDANVKITDASGKLIYEGKSLGGQAVWNGRDYLGKRAASGVYLVFATTSSSFDAPDAIITKVVILN